MNNSKLTFYDYWDLTIPDIPARSQLYSLKPIGIGTPYVESLTSYLTRLAKAHCITVGDLVSRILALKLLKNTDTNQIYDNTTGIFATDGKALNGLGLMARSWVNTIEQATLVDNIHHLTMLTWAEVLPTRGVLRSAKAWCPHCYEDWFENNLPIYEPLLWKINVITICPQHHQILQIFCPHCNQNLCELAHHSRPGYCSKCKRWLGSYTDFSTSLTADELQKSHWFSTMIGELLGVTVNLSSPIPRNQVSNTISSCISQLTNDKSINLSMFARKIGVSSPMVWHWQKGKKLIILDKILYICNTLKISIVDFFTGNVVIPESILNNNETEQPKSILNSTTISENISEKRHYKNHQEIEEARQVLSAIIEFEFPPPSLKSVKKRFEGIYIRYHFPDLYKVAVNNRALYIKNLRLQKMEEELRSVLASSNFPPPSMVEVVKNLTFSESALRRNFPELCHAISVRYQEHIRSQKAQRNQELCKSIKETVYLLHAQDIYPSSNRVLQELNLKSGVFLTPDVQLAFQEALEDLGLYRKKLKVTLINTSLNYLQEKITHN